MKESKFAVLGDPQSAAQLKAAVRQEGLTVLEEGELQIQDEWQVIRWMLDSNPTHVFVCVGLRGQNSVRDFMFTIPGSINVVKGAVGVAQRVRIVSVMPSVEYYLLRRLCELYFFEKGLDFSDILYSGRTNPENYYRDCVLAMRDVSAKEAHQNCPQGQQHRREVREQVVPQRKRGPTHELQERQRQDDPLRESSQSLLEVPQPTAQGEAPGDLHSQCHTPAGQETGCPVHHNSSPVSGVVS